jgi:hypothetical protein
MKAVPRTAKCDEVRYQARIGYIDEYVYTQEEIEKQITAINSCNRISNRECNQSHSKKTHEHKQHAGQKSNIANVVLIVWSYKIRLNHRYPHPPNPTIPLLIYCPNLKLGLPPSLDITS